MRRCWMVPSMNPFSASDCRLSARVDLPALTAMAATFAMALQPGMIIYLEGPLGAGKTTFVQALLAEMGVQGQVKSPTYTLVESYALPERHFHHFDLYRLKTPAELDFIGLRDYLDNQAICLFEWPDKGQGYLPPADWLIQISYDADIRCITLQRMPRETL